MEQPNYDDVCKYLGQLFIESRHTIQALTDQVNELRVKLTITEKERDMAKETSGR